MRAPFWLFRLLSAPSAGSCPWPSSARGPFQPCSGLIAGTGLSQHQRCHDQKRKVFVCTVASNRQRNEEHLYSCYHAERVIFQPHFTLIFYFKLLHKMLAMGPTTAGISSVTGAVGNKTRYPGSGRQGVSRCQSRGKCTPFIVPLNLSNSLKVILKDCFHGICCTYLGY